MTLDVVNAQNEKIDTVELSDKVFAGRVNEGLVWEAVVHENASDRRGTASTKTRGRVRGSGRKMWRQKGTGRARVGDAQTPLWRSGGTVFGPQPRDYGYQLPKKVIRGALRSALSDKINGGAVTVVDGSSVLSLDEPRTRQAKERLEKLVLEGRTVVVDDVLTQNLELAVRNLSRVRLVKASQLTARDVTGATRLVISKAAVERLERVLGP